MWTCNVGKTTLPARGQANGRRAELNERRSIRNAIWSNVPAVSEGAARVLAQSKEPWAREAIEESFIDDSVKDEILKLFR